MKFIFADCIDVIDPGYDFINDRNTPGRTPYWDDVYPHEVFKTAPYDGMLVSRAIVGGGNMAGKYSESQRMRFLRVGAKEFLRLHKSDHLNIPVFGDCGAFSYAKLESPPYTASDTVEFYGDGQFDYGCSIDHILFEYLKSDSKKTEPLKISQERYEITLQLATEFLTESKTIGKNFTPIGVVQGWDAESLARSANSLIFMGYKYIAIGGLVPLKVAQIHEAVASVNAVAMQHDDVRIHLLGFAKADNLDEFKKYKRIASFDSTSPLIRAFKDNRHNYWIKNENGGLNYYSAIRVPQSLDNNTFRRKIKSGELNIEELQRKESIALESLRNYDHDSSNLDETLDNVLDYSLPLYDDGRSDQSSMERKIEKLRSDYRRTLEDKPWKSCSCEVCKSISIETIIFRASNRNKRRGFHNLYVYHQHVTEKLT